MGTRRRITFDTVREIGEQLPGTEVGKAYGSPALKVNGRIYAGIAINREVEPNSLGVYLADFEEREALLAEDPDTYYVKPHYEPYPIILVRLARVTRDALEDLLRGAHRTVGSRPPSRRRATKRRR
jgi:hypothetical protein